MLMNLWVESGAIGVIFFVGFLIALFWSILRAATSDKQDNPVAWLTMTTLASFILANAAYQTTYWGYALVLAFFAICAARLCKSKAIE
jgi:O-antigen ligase